MNYKSHIQITYIMFSIMVTISINYNGKSFKKIFVPENRSIFHSFSSVPNSHAVTMKTFFSLAMDFELYLQFPIIYKTGLNKITDVYY